VYDTTRESSRDMMIYAGRVRRLKEEDCLYGFAFHGQKIDWMRANPNVCVEVDEIVDQYHWTTVLVFVVCST
jgi:nitroimidazol reductase NimA-like FMN-containing flavoprotein (pyridoxamine 5'-phosphate oxidase superfamily)